MPQLGLVQQEIPRFLGVNLREERMDLADEELAKSINADLNSQPGSIILRLGRTKKYTTATTDSIIRRVAIANAKLYEIAGQKIYRDQILLTDPSSVGLSGNNVTLLLPYKPLNDGTIWLFISDDAVSRKDDGTNLRKWGITAPSAAPTLAVGTATGLTGAYKAIYTYARMSGTSVAHESNPSPKPSATTLSNEKLNIAVVASTDGQVGKIRIYRTRASGNDYLFDQAVDNTTATIVSSQADTALGVLVEDDNDVPPLASWAMENDGYFFFVKDATNPQYLWWSKRFRPESVPSTNFLRVGSAEDALQCILPVGAAGLSDVVGTMGLFTKRTKYVVSQDAISGFRADEALSHRGTPSPLAAITTENGIIFVAKDGVFATNLFQADQQFADKILPLFNGEAVNGMNAINWAAANTIVAGVYKNRYYLSYPSGSAVVPNVMAIYSADTKRWYFYDHTISSLYLDEGENDLLGGAQDGFVYILEDGSTDGGSNISLDVQTKDYFGQERFTKKLYRYLKVDCDPDGDTLTANVYIDGILKRAVSITGSRFRRIFPLPEKTMGSSWRVAFAYTGSKRPRIYGIAMLYLPLGAA